MTTEPRVMLNAIGLAVIAPMAFANPAAASVTQTCNENGIVIRPDAGTQSRLGAAPLYLGKTCDAAHAGFGSGAWCWSNSGLLAEFSGETVAFADVEQSCSHPGLSAMDCSCISNPIPSLR